MFKYAEIMILIYFILCSVYRLSIEPHSILVWPSITHTSHPCYRCPLLCRCPHYLHTYSSPCTSRQSMSEHAGLLSLLYCLKNIGRCAICLIMLRGVYCHHSDSVSDQLYIITKYQGFISFNYFQKIYRTYKTGTYPLNCQ